MLDVLHLVGSPTDAFFADLSRLYAADCLDAAADPARYRFHVAYVTPDRRWRFPAALEAASIETAPAMPVADALAHVASLGIDLAVPQMFCPAGMTHYRALLDVLAIPFLGNTPEAMANTMHKGRARALVAAGGVDVPPGELLRRGEEPTLAPPVVVKPAATDNSVGVTLVLDAAELDRALDAAFAHGDEVLVERFIEPGREVRCGIVDHDGELVGLPLEEYDLDATRPIRGYGEKLAREPGGDLRLMAKDGAAAWTVDLDDPVTARVTEVARRCHLALGCRHYSLFDFRIDPDGRPWFLEAGLYCSFARQSVISTMAAAIGIDTGELFARSVRTALS